MRAESFTGYGGLRHVDLVRPQPSRHALVRITAAGVTPLDHAILSGGLPRTGPIRFMMPPKPCAI